jgi:hypothetical protein
VNQDGSVELLEETLSDGSKAFSIKINHDLTFKIIDCINEESAKELFTLLGDQNKYLF